MLDYRQTPDGRRLVVARRVDAPREQLWDLLRDTSRWPDWGPSVRAVDCDRRYVRAGTTGRVKPAVGPWLPFEVRTCENHRWTWRVARVPATGHFVDREHDTCRVGFELPVYAVGYAPVCRRALDRLGALV